MAWKPSAHTDRFEPCDFAVAESLARKAADCMADDSVWGFAEWVGDVRFRNRFQQELVDAFEESLNDVFWRQADAATLRKAPLDELK